MLIYGHFCSSGKEKGMPGRWVLHEEDGKKTDFAKFVLEREQKKRKTAHGQKSCGKNFLHI